MNDPTKAAFIVFKIADYFLALPISSVFKVINYAANNTNLNTAGLVQIGSHAIALLDLHQLLGDRTRSATKKTPFLLIASVQGELCAIPVEEPPNLVELGRDNIKTLPPSYHHHRLRNIVNYAAIFSEEGNTFTVFILDINRAWQFNYEL